MFTGVTWHKKRETVFHWSADCSNALKISDTDEQVQYLKEIPKVELVGDNARLSNTKWNDTFVSMHKQPSDEML